MKNKKMKKLIMPLVALLALPVGTGCTPKDNFDAATTVANFANKVETTVKLSYVTNYTVDVVRPGADASGMDSFKRDVVATAVVEMDLGADTYIKVTKTRQDRLVDAEVIKTEEVLYKKDNTYYYQTSSSAAVEVTNASEKLATIFEETTYEQIGGLTLDALLYNSLDKSYELKMFGLSDTFMESDLADPTYEAGENGGLKVTYKPEYIGYRTDGGWSDFSNTEDGYAATVELATNDKGFVTSMKETYNEASLVFNIMSNPPTVTINGERSFTATYGEAITKVDAVDFAASKAVLKEATGGTYIVKTCANGDFGNMTDVTNGSDLVLGNILCVRPIADAGYEVAKVIVNDSETPMVDPAMAGGFYCYAVKPGNNTIEVLFKAAEPQVAVVNVTNNTEYEYQLQSFTYAGAPSDYKVVENGEIEPGAAIFGAVVMDSTYEVEVYVNGTATSVNIPAGANTFYCFSVKTAGTYEVVINPKGAEAPADGTKAIVNVTNNTEYEYQLQSFVYANNAPSDYKVIENGEIEPGASIFGAIVIDSTLAVTVTVNGTATSVNIPAGANTFYCFSVKTAGTYDVVINPAVAE